MKLQILLVGLLGVMMLLAGCQSDSTNVTPDAGNGDADVEVCTTQYEPVCGVNGQTYSNACNANVANVEIAYEGECTTNTDEPEIIEYSEEAVDGQVVNMSVGVPKEFEIVNPPVDELIQVRIPQTGWSVLVDANQTTTVEVPAFNSSGIYEINMNGNRVGTIQVT